MFDNLSFRPSVTFFILVLLFGWLTTLGLIFFVIGVPPINRWFVIGWSAIGSLVVPLLWLFVIIIVRRITARKS